MEANRGARFWFVTWEDNSADEDHDVRDFANSAEEAEEIIRRILEGYTWTPEDAADIGGDETEPAFAALERLNGPVRGLLDQLPFSEPLHFQCDDGEIVLERAR